MTRKLKATKTSLYSLVGTYEDLPIMKRTEFFKYRRSYWLRWYDDSAEYEVYFSVLLGKVLLSIDRREHDSDCFSRQVHRIEIPELQERGMIEEFADAR